MSDYLLGIDLGTSGVKAVLLDPSSGRVSQALVEYRPHYPRPGWAEQDPEEWVAATVKVVSNLVNQSGVKAASIKGIGLAGQMHTTVVLDRAGKPFRPAILWLDQRSAGQVGELGAKISGAQLAEWIANPVFTGLTLASMMWIREEAPGEWIRVAKVVQPKDYVRYRMTGNLVTDFTDASATGLLSVRERQWCRPILNIAGIPFERLPSIVNSTDVVGSVREEMAAAIGVLAGTPVVCGAGDQQAQAIGNGIVEPGVVSCTIGTGGQLFSVTRIFRCDPQLRLHTFCHAAPDRWHWLAATLTAGHALRWLRDNVFDGRLSYKELADGATTVEPGAEGLLFLPYLAGERTPHMDPHARGVFHGLTLRHTWRHMARAVMEGVVMALNDGLELMRELGPVDKIIAAGGTIRHPLWLQLQADIFGVPVTATGDQEATATGAALLAGAGIGVFPDVDSACNKPGLLDKIIVPRADVREQYKQEVNRFKMLYNCYYSLKALSRSME
ncbi:MAG: xylulokinase [Anaerolineales bacterium]|nr:xylulokinase [Anaerolineales bacterium]